ncbi:unnamed protein product [Hymenolepis diminuta]|uniref:Uncharacterized protein n=1 Tax=Hymenolepis diminuta TaxID=6216 RepID=A0A564YZP6_HYMDI|nr:unnamed protein product [Hymenolepis diminuta]
MAPSLIARNLPTPICAYILSQAATSDILIVTLLLILNPNHHNYACRIVPMRQILHFIKTCPRMRNLTGCCYSSSSSSFSSSFSSSCYFCFTVLSYFPAFLTYFFLSSSCSASSTFFLFLRPLLRQL